MILDMRFHIDIAATSRQPFLATLRNVIDVHERIITPKVDSRIVKNQGSKIRMTRFY